MKFIKSLYLHKRFFVAIFALAVGFLISYWFPPLYPVLWMISVLFLLLFLFDCIALFKTQAVTAERILPEKFSNSDENLVLVKLRNKLAFNIYAEVIDEIPVQFQKRDFLRHIKIPAKKDISFKYFLRPVERGEYIFGKLNVYSSTIIKLAKKRESFQQEQMVKVYPSFIQMKKYDFLSIDNRVSLFGMKKIRKIGHTMEFEQIKDYVLGDDVRSINWKATAKRGDLMVNQFQDEKSQPVYSVIDSSRAMKMPFEGLKLLDYAINSTLAFSNIALKKKDKVGMLSFSNKIGNLLPATSKNSQLNSIQESLYNINTEFRDADFGLLYAHARRKITHRSLLMLYTNFEHISSLQRQIPYLLALNRNHLLVVIFFENSELETIINSEATTIPGVFDKTIAEQFAYDKRLMTRELHKYGIQTVLTKPEDLTVNTINKYLEIKKRGLL
ncbi:DUF58 domain-containing protein [Salinimicrobium sp. GXAS 041]|uniref:DUF58 domain-containing protein n=1 Tax=Salinimicrobium sp. GXAS 041 TaxID=3400806 RepID=UPI003C7382B4